VTEPGFWKWNARLADLATTVTVLGLPAIVAVFGVIKGRRIVHAAGWDLGWIGAVVVFLIVGVLLTFTGMRDRIKGKDIFKRRAEAGNTAKMVIGTLFLLLAVAGIVTY
jgi:hypothetical protein